MKEASSYPGNQVLGREEPQAQGYFRSCSSSDQNTHGAVGSDRREGGGPQWAPACCIPTKLPSPGKKFPSPKTCHSHGCRYPPNGRALALTSMASLWSHRDFHDVLPAFLHREKQASALHTLSIFSDQSTKQTHRMGCSNPLSSFLWAAALTAGPIVPGAVLEPLCSLGLPLSLGLGVTFHPREPSSPRW